MDTIHSEDVRAGVRIEIFTIAWMVVEMAVSIGAGIAAGSVLLVAFGLDSLIELVSGGMLLWRLQVESRGGDVERVEQAEKRAGRVVAVTLTLLCVYVLVSAVYGLVAHTTPENSPLGIGVSAAAVLVMPYLALLKRRIAGRIHSEALAGDAVEFDHLRLHGRHSPARPGAVRPVRLVVGGQGRRAGVSLLAGA